ncbi:GvpL/GvpF family gas vesicle protein [Calothrix sp. NIES-2100]|uniref:GvpL/GvpF family gas vesicle protein n=1 Tax=Calothrix sp. NIES-2100 TaxID=1954172 RepID=UPI000BBCD326
MESLNLYTYAFCQTLNIPLNLPKGHAGQLFLINSSGISAVVEQGLSLESVQNNDEQVIKMVLDHDRIIRELFQQTTVLPLRFGTSFASSDTLLNHIQFHAEEYRKTLDKIQGKTEYNLKLVPRTVKEPVRSTVGGGRDYFLAKKQYFEYQKTFMISQTDEKSSLINLITEIYQSSVIVQNKGEEIKIYILVSDQDKPLFLEQFLSWQEACPSWDFFLGEGLPPYHFV